MWTPVDWAVAGMSMVGSGAGGIKTASMTWMTPLLAATSAVVTSALSLMVTTPSATAKERDAPLTVAAVMPSVTSAARTELAMTW